jgi:hypothetical protein
MLPVEAQATDIMLASGAPIALVFLEDARPCSVPLPDTPMQAREMIRDNQASAYLDPLWEVTSVQERGYTPEALAALWRRVGALLVIDQLGQGVSLKAQAAFNSYQHAVHTFAWRGGRAARSSIPTVMTLVECAARVKLSVQWQGQTSSLVIPVPHDKQWRRHLMATAPGVCPIAPHLRGGNFSGQEIAGWLLANGYECSGDIHLQLSDAGEVL